MSKLSSVIRGKWCVTDFDSTIRGCIFVLVKLVIAPFLTNKGGVPLPYFLINLYKKITSSSDKSDNVAVSLPLYIV